jgi:hypothetical protein
LKPQHERWLDGLARMAMTLLASAIALYVAAKLIIAVLPVLLAGSAVGLIAWAIWSFHHYRQSRW